MKFAVLDFETTGSQSSDEIIQAGLAIIEEDRTVSRIFGSLVNPGIPIPPFITGLTGISNEDVADAPSLEEMMMQLVPLLDDVVLVGHNVTFDFNFLQNALDRCGYLPFSGRILDTIHFLKICFPSLHTYQLGMVASQFGLTHDRPHQADSDALATAHVLLKCLEELDHLPLITVQRLSDLFTDEDSDLRWFFDGLRAERENRPLDETEDQGKIFFRQFALAVDDWTDMTPVRDEEDGNPLENVTFQQYMQQVRDNLSDTLPNYESREAQDLMFQEVMTALDEHKHLLIEAGTGTGKSLGYLLPSIYQSVKQEQKVMISTHTINLQEQLRDRDVPLLTKVIPFPFQAAVFKGRQHYLCLRKFEHKINRRDFSSPKEDVVTAAQMIVWLSQTKTGDDEELNLGGRSSDFWESVSSDSDSCIGRACPWFRKCFYHRARHEAGMADVVITNHSKLFTDVKANHQLLPVYENLVIDEAHQLEEVAGKHLGLNLKYFSIVHTLMRLYKDSRSGQLPAIRQILQGSGHEKASEWLSVVDHMLPDLLSVKEHWDRLSDQLFGLIPERGDALPGEAGQFTLRLSAAKKPKTWTALSEIEHQIYLTLGDLARQGDRLVSELREDLDDYSAEGLVTDLNGLFKDLASHREELHFFMSLDQEETVYWMEANSNYRSKSLQLYAVPIDVSAQLKALFFDKKQSVILTSATLSVDKSFQYMIDNLGLKEAAEQNKLNTVLLPSPFNYRDQALLIVPRNFPSVKGTVGDPLFVNTLVQSLADAALATQGRMMVLFTSYKMLRQVYEPLKDQLQSSDIHVLGQGMDGSSRTKLIRRFQESPGSVLLGTSSFWEGVDIPGEALSCLAIVRLPFQPPNHPLVEAKSELLQQQKKNPFMKLSVPQAVIRFKQGFGRLVRTASDRGIVIVYDTRVIESYYGKYFLHSLPGPKMEHMPVDHMVPRISEWLQAP
ncbi:ATP-dependent DNA helicase DinG [Paenibacillus lemnae]|uniref:3'-5' exonuclease DinG n=1 Tax=Paenibacillus lemnae TaxID=1330551 RepID=A0A848MCZ5_PAELE|nr:ATP-dependent DNA helicase DinG [Paenibacillus lemnae]NMO98010.1 ATP-dependent DNA helicase DinG [Paenibacillus lemnae]